MPDFTPTDEQAHAIDLALTGRHLALEALAGTGKTSTLVLLANARHLQRGQGMYAAFNKAIADEARQKFPNSVKCSTMHALAMAEYGRSFRHRLNAPRMKSHEIAQRLGLDAMVIETKFGRKRLAAGFLAGMITKGLRNFCRTADELPMPEHIPVPQTMQDDPDLLKAWNEIREHLADPLGEGWVDVTRPDGLLPYDHAYYLKAWTLTRPLVRRDYLMLDEAQDLNGCMLTVVDANRDHCQIVLVGDTYQSIYEWNGAIDAIEKVDVEERAPLTHSFRFGPEIAGEANRVLAYLGADVQLTGRGKPGMVGPLEYPDVILTRKNATGVLLAMRELQAGGSPHIVGGADDVVSFAEGALRLQEGDQTWHPELACFGSWTEVLAYVSQDELGGDLKQLVDLVEEFTAEAIIGAFDRMPSEQAASVIISTAHKAKGREWHAVQLADDFPGDPDDDEREVVEEEKRLMYVAVTRAMGELDVEQVGYLRRTPSYQAALL